MIKIEHRKGYCGNQCVECGIEVTGQSKRCIKCHTQKAPSRYIDGRTNKDYYCIDCKKEVTKNAIRCRECDSKRLDKQERKVIRPTKEELMYLITQNSFVSLGKKFGVVDTTVRKWCRYYKIQIPKFERGYWLRSGVLGGS
mgnify:CR=1 FL=1